MRLKGGNGNEVRFFGILCRNAPFQAHKEQNFRLGRVSQACCRVRLHDTLPMDSLITSKPKSSSHDRSKRPAKLLCLLAAGL